MNVTALIDHFSEARRITGRSLHSLMAECVQLRLGTGKLGISEYFDFGLYRADIPTQEKAEFAGYRAQQVLEEILVDDYSRFLSLDKITYYQLMQGNGLPVPHTHAVYSPSGRHFPGTVLRTPSHLSEYLAQSNAYPLYVKHSFGVHGGGNLTLLIHDDGQLQLVGGKRISINELVDSLYDRTGFGWLIQESLRPHVEIARLCGDRISGVRAHVFLTMQGPRILIGVWKINSGLRDSENFLKGGVGNLVANIDVDSGRITRVVTGTGLCQQTIERHPSTSEQRIGITLPNWQELVSLLKQAATLFPGYLYQGWNIALTDRGPVPTEVNYFGDTDLPQFATGKGFLSEDLKACLRERGLDDLLNGRSKFCRQNGNGRWGRRRAHWSY
jgi:Sugar-transfer associated ATP-grasp